jgi:uncharacterized protein (DUF1697 family)
VLRVAVSLLDPIMEWSSGWLRRHNAPDKGKGAGMMQFIALLRAVNVGGVTLPMAALKAICDDAGFEQARTYIASGNALFRSDLSEAEVKAALERRLESLVGKLVPVIVRTAEELAEALGRNPFPDAPPASVLVTFLDEQPKGDPLAGIRHQDGEEVRASGREIYIHFATGVGRSKLVVPAAKSGTARNLNTVAKLAELAAALPDKFTTSKSKGGLRQAQPGPD